jgi:hypothetical protein
MRVLQWAFWLAAAIATWTTPALAIRLEPVLSGLTGPLYLTHARDGSGRLFVVEQAGVIKVLGAGTGAATVFLDIRDRVLSGGEQGLLGLAFHPQYSANGRFFIDYTRQPDGATVIAEYHRSSDPNAASAAERGLLVIDQPFANHNGGMVEFGPDGFLYIGMGDGGSGNDPGNRAQDASTLLGKILRIDVDRGAPYAIPGDNPFVGSASGRPEIFALGFRNPYRFSFDRATGQLLVGDVGQAAWEEIDIVTRGADMGWRVFEGNHCTGIDPAACANPGFTFPIAEYFHDQGRCSVTGGYAYRGARGALAAGTYVFGDFCSGEIFALAGGAPVVLVDTALAISSFGEDESGEVYVVDLNGSVLRLAADRPSPLLTAVSPSSRSVAVGTPASAFVTAINTGAETAMAVAIAPATAIPASFAFQTTDPATNAAIGVPNAPVDIPPGGAQTYVVAFTPSAPFDLVEIALNIAGANVGPAPSTVGLNTLLLTASSDVTPDVVALAATATGDGILELPGPAGSGAFAVAVFNAGTGGSMTVSTDTGRATLPVGVLLCQTNPTTAQCTSPMSQTVTTQVDAGQTPAFSAFVRATGSPIPFDPASSRIFVRFKDAAGVTRGRTSVAVRTR